MNQTMYMLLLLSSVSLHFENIAGFAKTVQETAKVPREESIRLYCPPTEGKANEKMILVGSSTVQWKEEASKIGSTITVTAYPSRDRYANERPTPPYSFQLGDFVTTPLNTDRTSEIWQSELFSNRNTYLSNETIGVIAVPSDRQIASTIQLEASNSQTAAVVSYSLKQAESEERSSFSATKETSPSPVATGTFPSKHHRHLDSSELDNLYKLDDRQNSNNIISIDIKSCAANGDIINVTASYGILDMVNNSTVIGTTRLCRLNIIGDPGSFLRVSFNGSDPVDNAVTVIVTSCTFQILSLTARYAMYGNWKIGVPPDLYSATNCLFLELKFSNEAKSKIVVKFTSLMSKFELDMNFLSSRFGIITSRFFDGVSSTYPPNFNSSVLITLPAEFSLIMLSFEMFQRNNTYDRVEFWAPTMQSSVSELVVNLNDDTVDAIFFNTSVRVDFISMAGACSLGVKLLFSFHTEEDKPQLTANGLYNCSGPNYQLFRPHLECNMREECENNADELGCWYSSTGCQGAISVGTSCYFFVKWNEPISWVEANEICFSKHSNLTSLNTMNEMEAILSVIQKRRRWQNIYIGLKTSSLTAPILSGIYKRVLQWNDATMALDVKYPRNYLFQHPTCGYLTDSDDRRLYMDVCIHKTTPHFLCEFYPLKSPQTTQDSSATKSLLPLLQVSMADSITGLPTTARCVQGHLVHEFLTCDSSDGCLEKVDNATCPIKNSGVIPLFNCEHEDQAVVFSLVCDHLTDCQDGSDENGCMFLACEGFLCHNLECIQASQQCDGVNQCPSGNDEDRCWQGISAILLEERTAEMTTILFDGRGFLQVKLDSHPGEETCPPTHFQCPSWHCLPVFLRCNGVQDCPNGEDEFGCDKPTCVGYYRCRNSPICLHADYVCDGMFQCPLQDDERFCQLQCPQECLCQGLAFVCQKPFPAHQYPDIRYLDASGSGLMASNLSKNFYLVKLILRNCEIRDVNDFTFPNLRDLDLSHNLLKSIKLDSFDSLKNLKVLILSWNPIFEVYASQTGLKNNLLKQLEISGLKLFEVHLEIFSNIFPNIEKLNMSSGTFSTVSTFSVFTELKILDLSNSPVVTFPSTIFTGMQKLSEIHADNYKLCCPQILPEVMHPDTCFSPVDEISSCDNLLRSSVYRAVLWIFAFVGIVGNVFSFVSRLCVHKNASKTGFGTFVSSLSLSDLLMGIYLLIIGIADQVFTGTYRWKDLHWKKSVACKTAGFLSFLSSEVSAFTICLITLDRFLVLRFPFSKRHFKSTTATVACGIAWFLGVAIALVPLLPVTSHWDFYGQSGICIPLPISRAQFPGRSYSFGVIIVLNFVLFLIIAAGQIVVFYSIRVNTMKSNRSTKASRDLAIAQRLAVIVVSNFLCWFPIGLLGLMASQGIAIPSEVSVGMATFILPLNSALNPFLYTFNAMIAKRREQKQKELMKVLETRLRSEMVSGFPATERSFATPSPRDNNQAPSNLRVASSVQMASYTNVAFNVEVDPDTSRSAIVQMSSNFKVDSSVQVTPQIIVTSSFASTQSNCTSLQVTNFPLGKITEKQIREFISKLDLSSEEVSNLCIKIENNDSDVAM